MLFRNLFCLFFWGWWMMFQTQFGGVHGVVVVIVVMDVKWGANAVAVATATGTGTCSNSQCDRFRHKCDIEWKASKDR